MAGPPSAKTYMGWWGHLGNFKQRGITSYAVSPYRQRPFGGVVEAIFSNFTRRVRTQVLYFAVPGYLYYIWWTNSVKYNEWLYTKDGREELARINGE